MEISVGFADKGEAYYAGKGYLWEESMLGRVYYPKEGTALDGQVRIRYMEYPWISTFEVDGIRAVMPDDRPGGQEQAVL